MTVTRTLLPADVPGLCGLLLRLGPGDRALRFGRPVDDAEIEAHCRALVRAGEAARVIGAFEDERLIGAAELWFDDGPLPRGCEVAIAVDATRRGRGVGAGLLGRAVLAARNRGAGWLRLSCRAENGRMWRLARRFAGDLRRDGASAGGEVPLPGPSWHSLWTEAALDAHGLAAAPAPGWWRWDAASPSRPAG